MSSKCLLLARNKSQCHQSPKIRLIGFCDFNERDAFALQSSGDYAQFVFTLCCQNDRMGVLGKIPWTRLPRSMHEHGGLNPSWEIRPHHYEVIGDLYLLFGSRGHESRNNFSMGESMAART